MTKRPRNREANPLAAQRMQQRKEHLDDLLDKGLDESFPASDPPAVSDDRSGSAAEDTSNRGTRRRS